MAIFKKKSKGTTEKSEAEKSQNWYADRYQTVIIQRNYLLLLTLVAVIGIVISVMAVIAISSSKSIEPFVIEIEKKTGITNVIRPLLKEKFSYDETLRRYFINKYITNRESYDLYSFKHNYFTVVRLLSTNEVYREFRHKVYVDNPQSPIRLGKLKRIVKIKSITFLKKRKGDVGFTSQIRFTATDGPKAKTKHLVATLTFDYLDLSLTNEERAINPLGFQVLSYRIDDEVL